jgi:hypothetical protein
VTPKELESMAIQSGNFAGVVLTDDDARAFERQISDPAPNEAGKRSLARGEALLARYGEGTVDKPQK